MNSNFDYGMERETMNGQPVTEELIQLWADEVEADYPVRQLSKRGREPLGDRPTVPFDGALISPLVERAERENVSWSEAIRAAIRAWVGAA